MKSIYDMTLKELTDHYNAEAKKQGLPTIKKFSGTRMAAIARCKALSTLSTTKPKVNKKMTDDPKKENISSIIKRMLLNGEKNAETIVTAVKEQFPDANTKASNVAWYRAKLRKEGLLPKV